MEKQKDKQEKNNSKTSPKLVLGVICNGYNKEDIIYYADEFRIINKLFKNKVQIHFIGIDHPLVGLEKVEYCYSKPVSIIHYYKHLHSVVKPDLIFVPLIPGEYNETSEDINKFLELALFGVPLITQNMYPYSNIINNGYNGILFTDKEDFIAILKKLLLNHFESIKICGVDALNEVRTKYSFINQTL